MSYAYLSFVSLLTFPLVIASALLQQTTFTNSTSGSPLGAAAGRGCPTSCRRKVVELSSVYWSSVSITATVTAETVLFVVNNRTNSTLTTTITNTEVDLKSYTPVTDLNSAGTRTTAVVVTNDNVLTTHTITYPTVYYQDYPSDYTICGTLPTTIRGVATCIEHPCIRETEYGALGNPTGFDSGAPSFTFPSHPPIAWPSQTMSQMKSDPKGLTYEPAWDSGGDMEYQVRPLFPNLGAWDCRRNGIAEPDTLKVTALYMTATSTVMNSHLPSELPTYSSGDLLRTNENGASHAPTITSSPLTSRPEEAATTLPEPSWGNAPTSKNVVPATSANGIIASKQAPLTSSSGIAIDNVPGSAVEATSPIRPLSSEQVPSPPITTARVAPTAPTKNPEQAPATASVSMALSSTDEQGHVVSSVAQLPAVIIPSTNPQGSPIATTLPGVESAPVSKAAPIILNSHTISEDANAQYLVSGQLLTPDYPITLGSGAAATPIAIHTSSSQTILVVGSRTSTLAAIFNSVAVSAVTIGNQVLTTNSENQMVVGTQTLAPDVPLTLGSGDAAEPVVIHTSSSHTILIIGSSTSAVLPRPTAAAAPALTIGSQILAVNSEGQYVVGSHTLAPGSPVTLGSGSVATPVLLQITSSNTILVIASSTSTLKAAAATAPQPITIGSQFISVNSQNQYIVGSQTLAPGSPITLGSGAAATPVLLQTTGSQTVLIAGSITSTLAAAVTAPPPITIGGQIVTANAEDQYVVNSQTLTPGGAITISGTQVSLAPSGTQVVVGTSTEALGNYIMSGFGAGPSGSASGALPFTGAARRQVQSLWRSVILGSGVVGLLVWL